MSSGRCDVCQRKPMHGNNVSFSQRRTRRRFVLNVQRRHMVVNGTKRTIHEGDIIQIPATVPHQILLNPGETVAYAAVKVDAP